MVLLLTRLENLSMGWQQSMAVEVVEVVVVDVDEILERKDDVFNADVVLTFV